MLPTISNVLYQIFFYKLTQGLHKSDRTELYRLFSLFSRDKAHPVYTREESNIVYTHKVSLRDALCGATVSVPLLQRDKNAPPKSVTLNLKDDVLKPTTTKRIQGEGLPYPKDSSRRGDLLVKFDIQFPDRISSNSKEILFDVLSRR